MKKTVSLITIVSIIICCVVAFSSCGNSASKIKNLSGTYTKEYAGTTLNVYNWAEYISDGSEGSLDIISEFEKLTGINVNYTMYESNEVMYSKLHSGSVNYDVIIPSDYMIERLAKENMLKELDYSKITNYNLIDDRYKGLYFDKDEKYTVPYNVGMVGLIYNSKMVDTKPDSWGIMWDKKYKGKVLMFNNSRDGFMISQMYAGVDINSENTADWDKAGEKLRELNPNLQGYFMDEMFNKMESGNAAIAAYYAGDFLTMKEENEDLCLVYPKEGTNIFVDSACVLKDTKNYEAALMFINFLAEPEVALANAEYIRYASPNTSVINNENYTLKDCKELYPDNMDDIVCEYYHDLSDKTRAYYEELWVKIKSEQ